MEGKNQLLEINLGEDPTRWENIGFVIRNEGLGKSTLIGNTRLNFINSPASVGIVSISVAGIVGNVDSLTFQSPQSISPVLERPAHPNRVNRIDHLVISTPNPGKTTASLNKVGIALSGVRKFGNAPNQTRQSFFWLGDVILELVGPDEGTEGGKPAFWGLALVSSDIYRTSKYLGELCTPVKDAVQAGRKITTIKTRDQSIGTSVAIMSPHKHCD